MDHCNVIHVNYKQSLVSMINTIHLKDYVGQLVISILQLYIGNVGIEDGEQTKLKESKYLIIAREIVSFSACICKFANISSC